MVVGDQSGIINIVRELTALALVFALQSSARLCEAAPTDSAVYYCPKVSRTVSVEDLDSKIVADMGKAIIPTRPAKADGNSIYCIGEAPNGNVMLSMTDYWDTPKACTSVIVSFVPELVWGYWELGGPGQRAARIKSSAIAQKRPEMPGAVYGGPVVGKKLCVAAVSSQVVMVRLAGVADCRIDRIGKSSEEGFICKKAPSKRANPTGTSGNPSSQGAPVSNPGEPSAGRAF